VGSVRVVQPRGVLYRGLLLIDTSPDDALGYEGRFSISISSFRTMRERDDRCANFGGLLSALASVA
jgi:hypothetical protein